METHKKIETPHKIPGPDKKLPDTKPGNDPEDPIFPTEPDLIPDEDPGETPPPFEVPSPGEGP